MHEQHVSSQVKKVPEAGKPQDSSVVRGLVCRKNLVHRRMRRSVQQPRILLLASHLELHRNPDRLASFDNYSKDQARVSCTARSQITRTRTCARTRMLLHALSATCCTRALCRELVPRARAAVGSSRSVASLGHQPAADEPLLHLLSAEGRLLITASLQEREHLRQAVDKLARLAPDVLLVERSVARDAQDALLQRNISLALNVKRSMLDRLARCTGAQVPTPAQLDALTGTQLVDGRLTYCGLSACSYADNQDAHWCHRRNPLAPRAQA